MEEKLQEILRRIDRYIVAVYGENMRTNIMVPRVLYTEAKEGGYNISQLARIMLYLVLKHDSLLVDILERVHEDIRRVAGLCRRQSACMGTA